MGAYRQTARTHQPGQFGHGPASVRGFGHQRGGLAFAHQVLDFPVAGAGTDAHHGQTGLLAGGEHHVHTRAVGQHHGHAAAACQSGGDQVPREPVGVLVVLRPTQIVHAFTKGQVIGPYGGELSNGVGQGLTPPVAAARVSLGQRAVHPQHGVTGQTGLGKGRHSRHADPSG